MKQELDDQIPVLITKTIMMVILTDLLYACTESFMMLAHPNLI